jgi:hypothetical protein
VPKHFESPLARHIKPGGEFPETSPDFERASVSMSHCLFWHLLRGTAYLGR